ncbi:DUF5996 family protein [Sphingomonas immobilis]|uniref:DUF5996 family protein n=1 Tax=Sphingomonas immobilis TaxID=3063997 RepID=A0ABT8ZX13_9SPHN|nr:DUF5996 family protein [Sphingomonas sp. CA1-15]MDO7841565.1 DUF5996 family protein [Sphingomonas sp. CA1-15]
MSNTWPALEWSAWRETAIALQLRTQIIGKVRLALTPWLNHSWHVPLYVSARGLTTSAIPVGDRILEIEFDFLHDRLVMTTSDGRSRGMELGPGSIADFHRTVRVMLDDLGVPSAFDGAPSEIADALPFAEDDRWRGYDNEAVFAFWQVLIRVARVFGQFRTGFLGKASPVHFFWGSFDLAATRFSGRVAPRHPGGIPALPDDVTCEAYSHEEASIGFWPGSDAYPQAAFYAYAYPSPEGYAGAKVAPEEAAWDTALGEFILPYAAVRAARDPDAAILAFCQSTYDAAADLAKWDRDKLECPLGRPRVVRVV